jgi:hypothetical protein
MQQKIEQTSGKLVFIGMGLAQGNEGGRKWPATN